MQITWTDSTLASDYPQAPEMHCHVVLNLSAVWELLPLGVGSTTLASTCLTDQGGPTVTKLIKMWSVSHEQPTQKQQLLRLPLKLLSSPTCISLSTRRITTSESHDCSTGYRNTAGHSSHLLSTSGEEPRLISQIPVLTLHTGVLFMVPWVEHKARLSQVFSGESDPSSTQVKNKLKIWNRIATMTSSLMLYFNKCRLFYVSRTGQK